MRASLLHCATGITLIVMVGCGDAFATLALGGGAFAPDARTVQPLLGVRPFEAQLSVARDWQTCHAASNADSLRTSIACEMFDANTLSLPELKASADRSTDSTRLAWGRALVDLASGASDARLGTIVEELTRYASEHKSANLQNDIAVALLASSARRNEALELVRALDAIEVARELDPTSRVIAFNRALILERLHLYEMASKAWDELATQADSDELQEINQHIERLRRGKTPMRFSLTASDIPAASIADPQSARERALDSLLERWSNAVSHRDSVSANAAHTTMLEIGSALVQRSGDSTVLHLARDITRPDTVLALALRAFTDGARLFRSGKYNASIPPLRAALPILQRSGAPAITDWDLLQLVTAEMLVANYAVADSSYPLLQRRAIRRHDIGLEARVVWGIALSHGKRGRPSVAIDEFARAKTLFDTLGEGANSGSMQAQRAEALFQLGRDRDALNAKVGALALFAKRRDAALRAGTMLSFGGDLHNVGLDRAALAVLREAVQSAESSERLPDHAESLTRLTAAEYAFGDTARARQLFARATMAANRITDTTMRARLHMERWRIEATALSKSMPQRAVPLWDSAAEYFRARDLRVSLPDPLVRAAMLRLARGDTAEAVRDLTEAALVTEEQMTAKATAADRRTLAQSRRSLYGTLMMVQLTRHDTLGAFLLAERGRGHRRDALPATSDRNVILAHSVTSDAIISWVVQRGAIRATKSTIAADSLTRLVDAFDASTRRGDSAAGASRALSSLLLEPVESLLDRVDSVIVMTDGVLERVPFAALQRRDGRYLIEQAAIVHSSLSESDQPLSRRSERSVFIGNPAFDAAMFPNLAALTGADEEARRVSEGYDDVRRLDGARATKPELLSALRSAALFHFGGHAQLVARNPAFSHLVLAKVAGGLPANVLTAAEIAALDLRQLQLVVLSSCGTTQAEVGTRAQTQNSLADAFFTAGAHGVVSSLWEADDAATTELMTTFHRSLREGASPSDALRRAQLALIGGDARTRHPKYWSAFRFERR